MFKRLFISTLYIICACVCTYAQEFALGADISWTTELESKGQKLYNYQGEEREAFTLMKELGLNAVRLRVWVDPTQTVQQPGERQMGANGWCGKDDVLAKALRAKKAGLDVMIDFHYSDWWADPGKQNIPAAWAKHKYKQMLKDVADHTTEVLQLLKDNGVEPKWVQVGNETSNGFLWPIGQLSENPSQYAGLFASGYEASKKVFPNAKVIVHLDNGFDDALYERNLDALKNGGAKWDIIGMSIYPYWAKDSGKEPSAARLFYDMRKNINKVVKRYGTDVMITETGFEVDEKNPWKMEMGREQLAQLIRICKEDTKGHCLGVFYWEPTCDPRHYKLGAFTHDGHPTSIMRAFTCANLKNAGKYDRPILCFETSEGDITVELYNETPKHRDVYLQHARTGAIDGTLFHRVIRDFMIQGGDPKSKFAEPTSAENPAPQLGNDDVLDADGNQYFIDAEFLPQFLHKRGALCGAREGDDVNPEKKSSSSQYYITWGKWPVRKKEGTIVHPYYEEEMNAGTPWLDGAYTVFGEVIDGLDIVEKIQKCGTDKNDRPLHDVTLNKLRIVGE